MFKPANVTADHVRQPAPDEALAQRVFVVLHGFYGNLFLSKFASGVHDDKGRDKGVASARAVWAMALQRYGAETVGSALDRCEAVHAEFPPSLPQFLSLCQACAPVKTYRPEVPAIGMAPALRSQYARQARDINARHAARSTSRSAGLPREIVTRATLYPLKAAIAAAVSAAGGDEAAELLRLDRMLAPREVA